MEDVAEQNAAFYRDVAASSSREDSLVASSPKFFDGSSTSTDVQDVLTSRDSTPLVFVVWQDLQVIEKRGRSRTPVEVLKKQSGYADARTMLGVLGPENSGKSALLKALAGRLPAADASGMILVNGRLQHACGIDVTYVAVDDDLMPFLTVQQTVTYSALLQVPNTRRVSIERRVAELCQRLGLIPVLHSLANTLGVGMRRRLSVACQLLNPTSLIVVNNVLLGINEGDALAIMRALDDQCKAGCTVVASLQHPSTDMCSLLGGALILYSGEIVYFGNATGDALDLLVAAGMPCPPLYSPIEQYMRLIDASFEAWLQVEGSPEDWQSRFSCMMFRVLQDAYLASNLRLDTAARIAMLAALPPHPPPPPPEFPPRMFQLWIVLCRLVSQVRYDLPTLAFKYGLAAAICTAYAASFSGLGRSPTDVYLRTTIFFVLSAALPLLAALGSCRHSTNIKVFLREDERTACGILTHLLAANLVAKPQAAPIAVLAGAVLVPAAGLAGSAGAVVCLGLIVFLSLLCTEALVLAVAAAVPQEAWQAPVAMLLLGAQILASGYFQGASRGINRAVGAVSFPAYAYQGLVLNELSHRGGEWSCLQVLEQRPAGAGPCRWSTDQVWRELSGDYAVPLSDAWEAVYVLLGIYAAWNLLAACALLVRRRRLPRCVRCSGSCASPAAEAPHQQLHHWGREQELELPRPAGESPV